jgi:predicted nucleic acid-binding protein
VESAYKFLNQKKFMQKRYYIDTCIWIDFLENRVDKFRPLGEWAFMLVRKIIDEEGVILLSRLLRHEISLRASEEKIREIVPEDILAYAEENDSQVCEASALSSKLRVPRGDALHAIIARDNSAVIVTRDRHFEMLAGIVDVKKPEELI